MGRNATKRKLSNASAEVTAGAQVDSKKAKIAEANGEPSAPPPTKPEAVDEEDSEVDEEDSAEGDEDDSGDKPKPAASAEDEPEETHYFLWGDAILSIINNATDEHPVLRRKEHIMEAYVQKKALGEDSEEEPDTDNIDIWDADAAEDDKDGKPFTSVHAKQFVEIYKAKDKVADERQAKKELKNTWWWVLTFTKREPVGDIPRIKTRFSNWNKSSHKRWLINMEVATDEEDEAMSEMLDHVISYSD